MKMRRAYFFISLQNNNDIVSKTSLFDERKYIYQMNKKLSFIISHSSSINFIFTEMKRKWIIFPTVFSLCHLDIIMSIHQTGRKIIIMMIRCQNNRIPVSRNNIHSETMFLQKGLKIFYCTIHFSSRRCKRRGSFKWNKIFENMIILS